MERKNNCLQEDWENLVSWFSEQQKPTVYDTSHDSPQEEIYTNHEEPQLELEEFELPKFIDTDTRTQKREKVLKIIKRFLMYWIKKSLKNKEEEQSQQHTEKVSLRQQEKNKRDDTTIAKVLFTQLKWRLLKERGCPVDMEEYFRVCDFKKNHRTLIDFEIPIWYVERLDEKQPGCLKDFRSYLRSKKEEILKHGQVTYANDPQRLNTYTNYLNRIYMAYEEGSNS
jgi:hypothetical protein